MIALPVCRWRQEQGRGQYICHSTNFVNSPNTVPATFCANCYYADHAPAPALATALPCVHLGGQLPKQQHDHRGECAGAHGIYQCALHDRCTITGTDQGRPNADRSCASCSDYVPRDPFSPSSAQMQHQAEKFLAAVPEYPEGRYQGRGVVIAGGGERFFPSLYVTVRALRHFGCRLPIQVWYLGRKHEMPAKRKALLASYQVECVDGDEVRRRHPARRLGGWELKVFATLHSPFEEVLFLDADCYPCRNPEFLFHLEDYRARGAIFWPDSVAIDTRLVWAAFGVPDPRRLGSVESGQFVLNKALCWRPLNLTWFYNDHSDYYHRYCHGDKHTFEVAWARCAQPFAMWEPKSQSTAVAYLQSGPDRLPLFVHRCRDKFRFESHLYTTPQNQPLPCFDPSLPLERECWGWLSELARHIGRKPDTQATKKTHRVSIPPAKGRFVIATLYTPDMAEMGQLTSTVIRSYAERHGYTTVIATARLDSRRHPVWDKLLLLGGYLSENPSCEWLMWIDADAVITNFQIRLEDLISKDVDFLIAEDIPPSPMNAGVFLVRNCPATIALLRRAYAKTQYLDHTWREQMALCEALRESADAVRTRVVSRRLFNSFAFEHKEGDFIKHFPGWPSEAKLAGVKSAIASASGAFRDLLPSRLPAKERGRKSFANPASPWTDLPPMFCITCSQTPERTAQAAQHFRERRLDVKFFPGIHGNTFGLRTTLASHLPMLGGHVGAHLSHYMLWQTLAYLPHEEILILEDDAWFEPTFRSRFRRAYADLPQDWQFAFVGAVMMESKPIERITNRVGVMRYPCGMHAYLVKRSLLPFLLQTNHEARMPIDLQLMANSFPAVKCYTFIPSLVKQRSATSRADGTGENWQSMAR